MSILVTGAAGFVGSHLIDLLEQAPGDPPDIVAWFRPGTEPLSRGSRVRWQSVELHDRAAVAAEQVIDDLEHQGRLEDDQRRARHDGTKSLGSEEQQPRYPERRQHTKLASSARSLQVE